MIREHYADPATPDEPVCGAREYDVYVPPTTVVEAVTCPECLDAVDLPPKEFAA